MIVIVIIMCIAILINGIVINNILNKIRLENNIIAQDNYAVLEALSQVIITTYERVSYIEDICRMNMEGGYEEDDDILH